MDRGLLLSAETSAREGLSRRLPAFEHRTGLTIGTSSDDCFVEMMRCYRGRGGLARELEVLLQLEHRRSVEEVHSAQLNRSNRPQGFERAIRFQWSGWTWLPLFQFSMAEPTLREAPARVVDALGPGFDGWDVAQWFVSPNGWLHDRRPIDVMDMELGMVLEAARTDRFVAEG